jgi:hypothetical protein
MGWLLLAGAVFLAITQSAWWWLAAVPLAIWRTLDWQLHSSRPWRRLHYPLMRRYAGASGFEMGQAEREGRPFDVRRALVTMVSQVEGCSLTDATSRVRGDLESGLLPADAAWISRKLGSQRPDPKWSHLNVDALRHHYSQDDNAVKVRLGIAGAISRQLGADDRAEYLLEAAKGNAP